LYFSLQRRLFFLFFVAALPHAMHFHDGNTHATSLKPQTSFLLTFSRTNVSSGSISNSSARHPAAAAAASPASSTPSDLAFGLWSPRSIGSASGGVAALMYGSGSFSEDTGNVLVQKPFFSPPKSNQIGSGNGGSSSNDSGGGGGGGSGGGGNGGGGLFGDMSLDGLSEMCVAILYLLHPSPPHPSAAHTRSKLFLNYSVCIRWKCNCPTGFPQHACGKFLTPTPASAPPAHHTHCALAGARVFCSTHSI
jgi:hypothetical protein